MAEAEVVTQRVLDQEPDTIALVPEYPNFLVVGTYSLISTDDDSGISTRRGSLQLLPFSSSCEQSSVTLDRKDFDFGIYDVGFHPRIRDILGVATSDGRVLIYRVQPTKSLDGQLERLSLHEIGTVLADEDKESGEMNMIITQLHFIDSTVQSLCMDLDYLIIFIVVTTQSGNTNLIETCINTASNGGSKLDHSYTQLRNIHRQSYELEAWTVLPLLAGATSEMKKTGYSPRDVVVISGGDDSQLLISRLTFGSTPSTSSPTSVPARIKLAEAGCTRLLTDKRTHGAGIVSTCLLDTTLLELNHFPESSYIFLTGSYDERIRLFHLKLPQTDGGRCELNVLSDFAMSGGVWRIMLLDSYTNADEIDYVFLIAGHTAGALILRLTCTPPGDSFTEALENWHYRWRVETHFTEHQSLVYAVAARGKRQQRSMWQLISTSFYDKLVCEWEWEDREWRSHNSTV